jgi:hypothetical protein
MPNHFVYTDNHATQEKMNFPKDLETRWLVFGMEESVGAAPALSSNCKQQEAEKGRGHEGKTNKYGGRRGKEFRASIH